MYRSINVLICLLSLLFSFGSLLPQNAWGAVLRTGDILVLDQYREAVFLVDPTTGARKIISSSLFGAAIGTGPSIADPYGMTVDALGNIFVAGGEKDGSVVRIDPATGNRTLVSSNTHGSGPQFQFPTGIVTDAQGNLIVSDYDDGHFTFSRVLRVDQATGDRTILSGVVSVLPTVSIGTGSKLDAPASLLVEPPGTIALLDLEFATGGSWTVVRIDPITGNRTLVAQPSGIVNIWMRSGTDLARDTSGNFYVTDKHSNLLARIDSATNASSIVAGPSVDFPTPNQSFNPVAVAIDDDGSLIVTHVTPSALLRINATTGQSTIVSLGSIGGGPDFVEPVNVAIVPAQVPEPLTAVLLALGTFLSCICWKRYR